jgi:peptidoglycan/LPS O-acetylase OafA/YrhL
VITLRRVTSSQAYLPFIDGLRFFAIIPVILVHFVDFYESHTYPVLETKIYRQLHVNNVIGNSDNAVLLFFAISGFVLGLPFAKSFFDHKPPPELRSFYRRRLTRLEPPYLVVLTGLLLVNVFIFHKSNLSEQLPHYFASFFYLHTIIYKSFPELNFVFWSLEIEVQFYLLAPLLAKVFKLAQIQRRIFLVASVFIFGIMNHYYQPPVMTLFNYIQYFLAGFLALDLFLNNTFKKHYAFDVFCVALLFVSWAGVVKYGIILPFVLTGLIYFSPLTVLWDKVISSKWIVITGGMCYSLYMLHHPVMAAFLNRIVGNEMISGSVKIDVMVKLSLSLLVIFFVSACFFILVERPCMKKDWYKNFLSVKK